MLKKYDGFTLIEMMITVVVLGILAAVAYPSYMRQMRVSGAESAKAVISSLIAAEKIARERTGSCVAGTPAGWVNIGVGNGLYTVDNETVDTGEAPNFEFRITNVAADSCTVSARGIDGIYVVTDTLICSYNAVGNPRQTWDSSFEEFRDY